MWCWRFSWPPSSAGRGRQRQAQQSRSQGHSWRLGDPARTADIIQLLTQATLVRVNRSTDQLEPWLAESWTSGNNNLTHILKLRPNILWSDGAPLSADEVASAINASGAGGASSAARVLGKPLTARARSAMEVEVTFPGSFGPGLRLLDLVPIASAHGGLGPFVLVALLVARGSTSAERGAAFLRDQLKNVGIQMDVTPVDATLLGERRRSRKFDAILGRLELRDSDPALAMDFWLRPGAATDWERRINDLMMKQATSSDRVERVQLLADVQKIYAEHMPEIFIAAPHTYVATSLRVRNVKPLRQRPALLWNADQLAVAGR